MALKVAEQAHKTDTGRQRHANEDSYLSKPPVFLVADGMGGAQAGEVASGIAAKAFEADLPEDVAPERGLKDIVQETNTEIHELASEDASRAGMGTTLTAAIVHGDEVSLAHVGDSRAYVLRDEKMKQLTKDHSLVEELRRQGRLTEEQAEEHPQRSVITRALGPEARVKVDTMTYQARPGDVFLLCTDGLTTMVDEDRIKEILSSSRSLRSAISKLIDEANKGGGRDNVTAVAFRLEGAESEADEGATLIARTAEQAGLTADRVRAAADRLRGREAPPAEPSRRRRRILTGAVVAAVVILAAVLMVRSIYFLGTDEDGRVALFRGLPYDLPLGIDLYAEQESIGVPVSELSEERQQVVTEHTWRSHDDALGLLQDIEEREGFQPATPAPAPRPKRPATGQRRQRTGGAQRR